MIIRDIYDLIVKINKDDISCLPGTTIHKIDIFESVVLSLPTCNIDITLPLNWIDAVPVIDAAPVEIILSSKILDFKESYPFRVFDIKRIENIQGLVRLNLSCVLSFYEGYQSANVFNTFSTTADIFKQVVNKCKLESDIDNTNDKQLWVAGENNLYGFLNNLSSRGWINDVSAMIWFFDRTCKIHYKNMTELFRKDNLTLHTFVQKEIPDLSKKEYSYYGAKASLQCGTNNIRNEGYGGTDTYFDLLSYSWKEVGANKVIAESNLININKDVSKGLSKRWLPFNVGNFNVNYERALKQNKRILSTYSSYVTLTSSLFQPYQIGEVVNLLCIDTQDPAFQLKSLSGKFMIDAIHITITVDKIISTVELCMQGLNANNLKETY